MKAKYSTGYTLDNNLQVVTEVRAYVSDDKHWPWHNLMPAHRYNQQYDFFYHGSFWRLKGY